MKARMLIFIPTVGRKVHGQESHIIKNFIVIEKYEIIQELLFY